MIKYRVWRDPVDGSWVVSYRYTPSSSWYRISSYMLWSDAIHHAFTDAAFVNRRQKLITNSAYGKGILR